MKKLCSLPIEMISALYVSKRMKRRRTKLVFRLMTGMKRALGIVFGFAGASEKYERTRQHGNTYPLLRLQLQQTVRLIISL